MNEMKSRQFLSGKRKKTLVANWKMNLTEKGAIKLAQDIKDSLLSLSTSEIILCPPYLYISEIKKIFANTVVQIGGQDVFWKEEGAYTGEISPKMLADFCKYVICGHSERRQYFGETDEDVNKKAKAVLKSGLVPVICVGEDEKAWKQGNIDTVLDQVRKASVGISREDISKVIIAYEPIWAIGTGNAATADYANKICMQIRQLLDSLYSREEAGKIRILYGGSVTKDNAVEFVAQSEIDGLLIGGASLKAKEFIEIVRKTNKIK